MRASLIQFLLGFVFGVVLLAGGAAGTVYLFVNRLAEAPPKPVFPEETAAEENEPPPETAVASTSIEPEALGESAPPEPTEEELPSGAYRARVTWGQGLSLRAEPNPEAERVGGIGYNSEITILNNSEDQNWQYVRIPSSGQEGWIKAGNVERIDAQ
ncbi:MAG: SH3 domain-containing protein [Cyanophyceae cyanobacterium]